MADFYKNYVAFCNKVGKSPSGVALEIGLSKTAVNGWKKKRSNPTDATLQKLADYFGVSVSDLLLGESEKSPTPEGAELIPGYSDLSDDNKEKAREFIAFLLTQQQNG